MTDEPPLPPTVIVPSRRCWQWYAHRPHRPHLIGDPPNVYRCEGVQPADPPAEEVQP